MNGYVKLFRKFLTWEWYSNINTKTVFIHCLLKANWEDKKYEGQIIKRGSFVTGRKQLAKEVGISEQQVRTALSHLISTNEITIKKTNKYSIISINNFDEYQVINQQDNQQITNNQPTNNQQVTTTKNIKNNKNIKNKKEIYKEKYFENEKLNKTFLEFLQLRKKLKAVNSDRAITLLINQLSNYDDETKLQMIEQSILNSWKSVYEIKKKNMTYADRMDELFEEL